ncbi:MAG: hypothetical protein FVQ81_04015 [Candidatus Glassbacteria bacterium]|nr:hypothetical protein [Candidatus Glassbacteria bacterium]
MRKSWRFVADTISIMVLSAMAFGSTLYAGKDQQGPINAVLRMVEQYEIQYVKGHETAAWQLYYAACRLNEKHNLDLTLYTPDYVPDPPPDPDPGGGY